MNPRLDAIVSAMQVIEREATGNGSTQLGAAFALGALAEAVDARPGWTAEDIARALMGIRPAERSRDGAR